MTEPERRALRARIDEAARATAAKSICAYCGCEFIPKPKNPYQRFCRNTHRKNAWRKTQKGRAIFNASRSRRRRIAA